MMFASPATASMPILESSRIPGTLIRRAVSGSDDDEATKLRRRHRRITLDDGLDMVMEVVQRRKASMSIRTSSTSSSGYDVPSDSSAASYQDLIQEGLVTFFQSMQDYNNELPTNRKVPFETYARIRIERAIERTVDSTAARHIKVPQRAAVLVREARKIRSNLTAQSSSTRPSENAVADQLGISARTLEHLEQVSRGTLSMESTLETGSTLETDDSNTKVFRDQEMWELMHGDEEFHAFMEQQNRDDEFTWMSEPLKDKIVDRGALSPTDAALQTMLENDVDDLLAEALTKAESKIIRLRYGIKEKTWRTPLEIAAHYNIPINKVRRIEERAMKKLRVTFKEKYAETYGDGEYEAIEDSV